MSMRCPRCGSTFPDDVRFCAQDGTRLLAVQARPVFRGASAPSGAGRPPGTHDMDTLPAHAPAARAANLAGQFLEGRYRVERKVGEGGMSFVYRATDEQTGQAVAIKVLSPSLAADANAMARLRREATLGARL